MPITRIAGTGNVAADVELIAAPAAGSAILLHKFWLSGFAETDLHEASGSPFSAVAAGAIRDGPRKLTAATALQISASNTYGYAIDYEIVEA